MATKVTKKTDAKSSAAPGTTDEKGSKEKVEKVVYPGLLGDIDPETKEPARLVLKDWPEDFDPKKHKPLLKRDFETEAPWLINRAEKLEAQAKAYRDEAEMVKKLGSKQDRAKAKKLIQMRDRMAELRAQLEAEGIDVDALTSGGDE